MTRRPQHLQEECALLDRMLAAWRPGTHRIGHTAHHVRGFSRGNNCRKNADHSEASTARQTLLSKLQKNMDIRSSWNCFFTTRKQVRKPSSASHQEITRFLIITAYLEQALRISETDTALMIATADAEALSLTIHYEQSARF